MDSYSKTLWAGFGLAALGVLAYFLDHPAWVEASSVLFAGGLFCSAYAAQKKELSFGVLAGAYPWILSTVAIIYWLLYVGMVELSAAELLSVFFFALVGAYAISCAYGVSDVQG